MLYFTISASGDQYRIYVSMLLRTLFASLVMFYVVQELQPMLQLSVIVALLLWSIVGAITFFITLYGVWWLMKRPFGIERLITLYSAKLFNIGNIQNQPKY